MLDFMSESGDEKTVKKRKDPERARRFWERVISTAANAPESMNISELSERALHNRTHIASARRNGSLPDFDSLMAISRTLKVPVGTMAAWVSEDAPAYEPPSAPEPAPGSDMTLAGFLAFAQSTGLARWASTARASEAPTLAEAMRAAVYLTENPAFSTSDGAPTVGWAQVFRELRANGFAPPKASPKPQKTKAIAEALDGGELEHGDLTAEPPKRVVRRAK